jgi:hypothetical protein
MLLNKFIKVRATDKFFILLRKINSLKSCQALDLKKNTKILILDKKLKKIIEFGLKIAWFCRS